MSLKLLQSYHTLKAGIFQEKIGYFAERNDVSVFLGELFSTMLY